MNSITTTENSINTSIPTKGKSKNLEKYFWVFMRISGLILIILTFGHLFIMLGLDQGVHRIDAEFVKDRWRQPFWKSWDLLMLWLAELHGATGLRVVIADYTNKEFSRKILDVILFTAFALVTIFGSYALITY